MPGTHNLFSMGLAIGNARYIEQLHGRILELERLLTRAMDTLTTEADLIVSLEEQLRVCETDRVSAHDALHRHGLMDASDPGEWEYGLAEDAASSSLDRGESRADLEEDERGERR